MAETKMPAAEATVESLHDDERGSYEFAFHILPTVAEGEVPTVFEAIKDIITKGGGELFGEEAPERFDLAYEIVQHMEGKNRKFSSAYFGWVRFRTHGEKIADITSEMEARTDLLRYLLIKLSKSEETAPFFFHEALKDEKMVTTVEESKVMPDLTTVTDAEVVTKEEETKEEEGGKGEVDEKALDEALEKKEL
ncbi:30S ribosomal protein S6 [Candidatus Pacebacteria bacterium]|nr:30S ribosomal protein S6 [Candidatus Paceibacterota bacterium]